jgi:Family of unknown function (DUF5923)
MQKNADELFQNFVWHTRGVDTDKIKRDPKDIMPDEKETSEDKKDGLYRFVGIMRAMTEPLPFSCSPFAHVIESRHDKLRSSKASFRFRVYWA